MGMERTVVGSWVKRRVGRSAQLDSLWLIRRTSPGAPGNQKQYYEDEQEEM